MMLKTDLDTAMSNRDKDNPQNSAIEHLRKALDAQRQYLISYEKPSEPLAFETLRTFDDLFCRDLMEPERPVTKSERHFRNISTWGVNHALRRIVPKNPAGGPFRYFPSKNTTQTPADDFIFNCGTLALAERFEGWLIEGILKGEIREHPQTERWNKVLVLRSAMSSSFDEAIGQAGLGWASRQIWEQDRNAELALEKKHPEIEPEMHRHARLIDNWVISYSSSRQIDDYFLEWAKLYLRRIFSQDMIGPDDIIGGHKFVQYMTVLEALSARSQKHIAFAAILRARHPTVHIRNLLTTYSPRRPFIEALAAYIDADFAEIESILRSLILASDNLDTHTLGGQPTWAPIVQASTDTLLLPTYGMDINPFLFLLTDLRFRYESDWFSIANNREGRWVQELTHLLSGPRWKTNGLNVRIRENGKDLTDIDFAAFDIKTGQLALFQLKWQHPVGMDNRGRRSAGKNLIQESNRWITTVHAWLGKNGAGAMMKKMEIEHPSSPKVFLFVLGRYHVHLSGYEDRDKRATWSDWAHFQRAIKEGPSDFSIEELSARIHSHIDQSRTAKGVESMMFPVGNIGIILNPSSTSEAGNEIKS
jgi:hypothetical protein